MPNKVNIITSNIRFDNPNDGINAWPKRKDVLVSSLMQYIPDIIGTQEGRRPQLNELEELLPNMYLVQEHRQWIDKRMYPCLYINKEKIKLLDSCDIWLSETPHIPGSKSFDSAFPRLCTAAKLEINDQRICCFNVHLDHEKESTRQEQIKVLIHQAKLFNDQNWPCLFIGDFNTDPESEVYKLLISSNLSDPWEDLNLKEETSYHRFEGEFEQGKRIDWILHSNDFTCESIKMIKDSDHGVYPSDHFPILANLNLGK